LFWENALATKIIVFRNDSESVTVGNLFLQNLSIQSTVNQTLFNVTTNVTINDTEPNSNVTLKVDFFNDGNFVDITPTGESSG